MLVWTFVDGAEASVAQLSGVREAISGRLELVVGEEVSLVEDTAASS